MFTLDNDILKKIIYNRKNSFIYGFLRNVFYLILGLFIGSIILFIWARWTFIFWMILIPLAIVFVITYITWSPKNENKPILEVELYRSLWKKDKKNNG